MDIYVATAIAQNSYIQAIKYNGIHKSFVSIQVILRLETSRLSHETIEGGAMLDEDT